MVVGQCVARGKDQRYCKQKLFHCDFSGQLIDLVPLQTCHGAKPANDCFKATEQKSDIQATNLFGVWQVTTSIGTVE
jgi:hypothetical protein